MENSNRRLYEEILKVKSTCGDIDFNTQLAKVLSRFETREIISTNNGSNIKLHLEYYLEAKRYEGITEGTLENYRRTITKLAESFENKNVDEITTHDLRNYFVNMKDIKETTKKSKVEQVKTFFAWLKYEEYIYKDPALKLKPIQVPRRLRTGLSITELEIVRMGCRTTRERAFVELLFATGCRISEVVNMNIQDLNFSDYTIRVVGKGNKERYVCFNEKSALYIKMYLQERNDNQEALFVSERVPHQRLRRRALQCILTKVKSRIELEGGLYPHRMRHTMATLGLQAGIDLTTLQTLLGHSDPSTTLIYARQNMENIKYIHRQKLVH